jgi:tetratricopeptide (TPR) repeat protein
MNKDSHVSLDGKGGRGRAGQGGVGPVCCVFSTAKSRNPGRGTTLRGQGRVHYWLVRQAGGDGYAVRGLDGDFLPFGEESRIGSDELLEHYMPEVAVFEERMLPSARRRNYRLVAANRESGYRRSLLVVDEANVRGLFELGREYFLARRTAKGRALLGELLRVRTPFPGKDQFLFNEFGIALRKIGWFEGAVICYRRALKYTDIDDHLFYNLARAYYEQGQWWDCMTMLTRCFERNPELPLARDLVVLIEALAGNPALRRRYGKPPVPDGVARRAALLGESVFAADAGARGRTLARSLRDKARDTDRRTGAAEPRLDERRDKKFWLPGRDAVGL